MKGYDFFKEEATPQLEESNDDWTTNDNLMDQSHDFFKDDLKTDKSEEIEQIEAASEELEEDLHVTKPLEELNNKIASESFDKTQKFKVKIDGEEQEVELQELLNSYSGKKVVDRKFSELDKEKQQYKKDLDSVNKYINEFAEKSKKSPTEALEFLAGSVGMNTLEFRRNMRGEFLKNYANYANMSDQERRMHDIEEENNYYKSNKQIETERINQEREQAEFQNNIKQLQSDHNIDDSRLEELVGDLRGHGGKSEIYMKDVIELHQAYARQDRAIEVLGKVDKEFLKDESKIITLESLLAGNSKLTDEDLQNYVLKLWKTESKSVESLSKKVKVKDKEKPALAKKKESSNKKIIGGGQVDFF